MARLAEAAFCFVSNVFAKMVNAVPSLLAEIASHDLEFLAAPHLRGQLAIAIEALERTSKILSNVNTPEDDYEHALDEIEKIVLEALAKLKP
jgi:hypothetical protein